MSATNVNSVFYADSYHPIQAGSIDGTDTLPHDNAVYRALLCSSAGLYDPFGDPKIIGDPYCTVFVGRLSHQTHEESLREAMSKYGRVKNLRLVRHIVTGASRGYAFVEYETEREMRCAYKDAQHSFIDDSEVIVDYNRQQLMPGWIPRRLGGGLGGRKESGQLRFGGRDRPFRAPLRPIPHDDLKRLGIPPPPEGRYMSRFQIPSPPRRTSRSRSRESSPLRHRRSDREGQRSSHVSREGSPSRHRISEDREQSQRHRSSRRSRERSSSRHSKPDEDQPSRWSGSHQGREESPSMHRASVDTEELSRHRSSRRSKEDSSRWRRFDDPEEPTTHRSSHISEEGSPRHRDREEPHRRRSSPTDTGETSRKRHRHHSSRSHQEKRSSAGSEHNPA